ncbi:hypothetical protein I8752_07300 [Nostocaceae cyanobacterium CENA369]|uniref:Uncharacterized protein n=2 Tax=Dendronalium TaxID=2840442 RepID=A0A8J7I3I8_9NOST|nr:hypothetical protein [Dendronalium phyllosphericum CENA369]
MYWVTLLMYWVALLMYRVALLMHGVALLMHWVALLMYRVALLMYRVALPMYRDAMNRVSTNGLFVTFFADRNHRMVTNSSAEVGWIPTVASKLALVAPIFTAIATP